MNAYKLTDEQRAALEGSRRKWQRVVADHDYIEKGASDCECCKFYSGWDFTCLGESPERSCPIALRVGNIECAGTPFSSWYHAVPDPNKRCRGDSEEALACAERMLRFIEETLNTEWEIHPGVDEYLP